jgi:superfamily II DNA or RNA helicase/very-short-patch-repair endonuclease
MASRTGQNLNAQKPSSAVAESFNRIRRISTLLCQSITLRGVTSSGSSLLQEMQPESARSIPNPPQVTNASSPAEKIALFRSLFRGREDVYPRRFESRKTNKAGYAPACSNEWVRGICEKPKIKCAECPHRRFLPVTDEVIRWHLSGRDGLGRDFVLGVYPMLLDETCLFLAVDFDRESWRADAAAFVKTCRQLDVPVALERSRSGNGGHVWFFFAEAVSANAARKLGSHILTETMERRPDLGLGSYDRLFPNQDTLPKGGFGNLIALPLQKRARDRGNSVFLDDEFNPHPDQWAFLCDVPRISRARVEALAREAETKGRVIGVRMATTEDGDDEPWTAPPSRRHRERPIAGPFPENIEMVLGDQIYVPKENLPPALRNRLVRLAAFQNPEFYRAQAMRLPTYSKPRIIHCAEDHPKHIGLPRGCLEEAQEVLDSLKIKLVLRDERCAGAPLDVSFHGELRPEQQVAAEAMLRHETGVLSATTAFGKTVLAAWMIARRGVNTLVIVHRQQLLEQWIDRLSAFLGLPAKQIGRLGGGRKKLTGALDVALVQSLVHKGVVDDRVADYGHIVVDECHHLSASSFELVARRAKAKYFTGLSATVTRKDGHHPIIFMQCGAVRHRVDARQQAATRPFTHSVLVRPTGFRALAAAEPDLRVEFQKLYDALWRDEKRNAMICADVLSAVREGRSPLVLTERTEHLELLAERLSGEVADVITMRGGMGRKALQEALGRLAGCPPAENRSTSLRPAAASPIVEHKQKYQPLPTDSTCCGSQSRAPLDPAGRVIVATGRFIGEGFDDPRLDTLFLALPISWRGTVAQYVGRLHRLRDGKREVRVYDYADLNVTMLANMFDRRCRGYESLGYTVQLPASALPGWPVEVPLPIQPEWKRDYAASVRRLIRDGVDTPLANLFVHVARSPSSDAEGAARARSASEAFLYRRFETLEATAGRFRLNTELPIPFDNCGVMEVDFLCAESRVVIELDGAQHLADVEAYRRDRRKDALLQHHGYFVLRFLAEDAGKQLDHVLDTILAALVRRQIQMK